MYWPDRACLNHYATAYSTRACCGQTNVHRSVVLEERWEGNVTKKSHETAGFCCTSRQLHICCWLSKSTLASIMWRLWSIRHVPQTCPRPSFHVPASKSSSERTKFRGRCGSKGKYDENTGGYRKLVCSYASRRFTSAGEGLYLSQRTNLTEMLCK
jgi:hypothetical protein